MAQEPRAPSPSGIFRMPTFVARRLITLAAMTLGTALSVGTAAPAAGIAQPLSTRFVPPPPPCAIPPAPTTLMVDAAYVPVPDQLQAMRHDGARIVAGYLWSPDALNPWSRADFNSVRAAGLLALPIFVGPASGSTADRGAADAVVAIASAHELGFTAGPVVLDVEPYASGGDPAGVAAYTLTWSAAMRHAGFTPWGYGLGSYFSDVLAGGLKSLDGAWVAAYPDDPPANPDPHSVDTMPPAWNAPGTRGWQYAGSVTLEGASVDLSAIDSGIAAAMRPGNC